MGYKNLKFATKPGLTEENKKKRYFHAIKTLKGGWKAFIRRVFSDESSVCLGMIRGKRRAWRLSKEAFHRHVTRLRWKGRMEFMVWGAISWAGKSPLFIWKKETAAQKKKYDKMIQDWNEEHEEEHKVQWEEETQARRETALQAIQLATPGRKKLKGKVPQWKHTEKTGAMTRKGKGGIDWIRYRYELLEPVFLPYMRSLGPGFVAQQDNASPHACNWNRGFFADHNIEEEKWPPNSPDLSPIEPLWGNLKMKTTAQGVLTKAKAHFKWHECWLATPNKLIRRYYRRAWNNLKWVVFLRGGNTYKEGSTPPENWDHKVDWNLETLETADLPEPVTEDEDEDDEEEDEE